MNHQELREQLENVVKDADRDTDAATSRLDFIKDIKKEQGIVAKHKEFVKGINTAYMITCRLEKISYKPIKSNYLNY